MDDLFFFGFYILLFVGLPVGLGLLIYFLPNALGYPKTGKYLTIIYGLVVLSIVFVTVFEDEIFSENDAQKLIAEQGIQLNDEFDLVTNKSMSAIGDYYHTFTLTISQEDKQRAINQIKASPNFKKEGEPVIEFLLGDVDRYNGPKQTQNYETGEAYIREYHQPHGQGYAPTFRRISISKKGNNLTFEDIDP